MTSSSVPGLHLLTSPIVVADLSDSNALTAGGSVLQHARLLCCRSDLICILSSLVAASVMMQKAEIIQRLAFSELVSKHYLFIIQ